MSNLFYHKDLTDAQWNRIKFLIDKREKVGCPSLNPRRVFNPIMWILKSGARWRDLPAPLRKLEQHLSQIPPLV